MAFISGPVSYQRFYVTGSIPSEADDKFMAALNEKTFGKIAMLADETQVGWIGSRHLFETELEADSICSGRFVQLGMRLDKLKIPANVLKAYIRMEEETALQASGREFLGRQEKRRAKDVAVLRAEQEAKDGRYRRISSFPVLIDLETSSVYLGNLGGAVGEKFMQLFADTFGVALEPADPERVATRLLLAANNSRALENLLPSHLIRPPEGADAALAGSFDMNFLGREFLSWLWYQTDAEEGPLRVHGSDDVTVMIDRTICLRCDFGLTGTDTINADGPTSLPEAKAALSIGKQPVKMGLILGCPVGEFRLTLDGPRMTVSSLVLPEDEAEQDARARIEQRFELTADAADLLDALFELFLLKRTNKTWTGELRKMSKWAVGDAPALQLRTG